MIFDVKNLSSRKLWELSSSEDLLAINPEQQKLAIMELLERGHYLEQLNSLPQLNLLNQGQFQHYQQRQAGIEQLRQPARPIR